MVGTITIPTIPICPGIPGVHIAGVSAWDLDTRDGAWASVMEITIVHIMATADTTVVTTVVTTDATPTTEVPTGVDTTMDGMMDIITVQAVAMETIVQIPTTVMDRWIADIHPDIHIGPM